MRKHGAPPAEIRIRGHALLDHLDDLMAASPVEADGGELRTVDEDRVGLARLLPKLERALHQLPGDRRVLSRQSPAGEVVGGEPVQYRLTELVRGRLHPPERGRGALDLARFE